MKKLNKTEVNALANKIRRDLSELAEKEQKKFEEKELPKTMKIVESVKAELEGLSDIAKEYIKSTLSPNKDYLSKRSIQRFFTPKQTKVKTPARYGNTEIQEQIILAQIESSNLDELISSVINSYREE